MAHSISPAKREAARLTRLKAGYSHGATDEFGRHAVEGRMHTMDLHVTLRASMGLDQQRLTYNDAGPNFRLTDVGGHVAREIFI